MKCHICERPDSASYRVKNEQFKAAVTAGFSPFTTPGFPVPPLEGPVASRTAWIWRTGALGSINDWLLCADCHSLFQAATGGQPGERLSNEAAPQKQRFLARLVAFWDRSRRS